MEHCPVHQKSAGSIPGPSVYRRQLVNVSLSHWSFSLSLPSSLSLKPIKTYPWMRIKKEREKNGLVTFKLSHISFWMSEKFWEDHIHIHVYLFLVFGKTWLCVHLRLVSFWKFYCNLYFNRYLVFYRVILVTYTLFTNILSKLCICMFFILLCDY